MARPPLLALVVAAAIAACTKRDDPCSNDNQKADLAGLVGNDYLYSPELLPATVDLGAYADPAALLDALTKNARDQGKDRGWSYLTTVAAQQQFFTLGTFVGFGFGVVIPAGTTRLLVGQVYPSSAASAAGFKRGDEVIAVGTADPLTPVSELIASDQACVARGDPPDSCNALGDALGPATIGLPRQFDVVARGSTTTERRAMTKASYGLDPVPAPVIIPRQDAQGNALPPAGYVRLRTFISPADDLLVSAFHQLKAAGVTDVIVDLRYNGGGLLQTANLLADLLVGSQGGSTMFEFTFNRFQGPANNGRVTFAPLAESMTPTNVAFLVSKASASASELVPNVVAPYVHTALVGHQTYGKPVGQSLLRPNQCGAVVVLVTFELSNSAGFGGYFDGLPAAGFQGCGVAADDDLSRELGDPAEGQTAAALQWFANPACPTLSGPLAVSRPAPLGGAPGAPDDVYPSPSRPTEAQRHVPGLF
jgi:carboxyl-terminal processing protease